MDTGYGSQVCAVPETLYTFYISIIPVADLGEGTAQGPPFLLKSYFHFSPSPFEGSLLSLFVHCLHVQYISDKVAWYCYVLVNEETETTQDG